MKLLHIEADETMAQSIGLSIGAEGFTSDYAFDGEEGVDLAKRYDFDGIILGLDFHDMDGLEVLRRLRVAKVRAPVLVLTGYSAIGTKIKAFKAGADDYMTTPCHRDELVARLTAMIRRAKGHASPVLEFGNLTVDILAKTVGVNGEPVHLTGKEYQILEILALSPETTKTKDAFIDRIYGGMDEPEVKIIDVFICKVRAKLRLMEGVWIETVWSRGYRLTTKSPKPKPQLVLAPSAPRTTLLGAALWRLIAGDSTTWEIVEAIQRPITTASAIMSQAHTKGLVTPQHNRDRFGRYTWTITQAGRDWLKRNGHDEPVPVLTIDGAVAGARG